MIIIAVVARWIFYFFIIIKLLNNYSN